MIGEIYLPVDKIITYYGIDNSGAQMPGNFQLLFLQWKASEIASAVEKYESSLPEGAWPNWMIGNHDRPRLISRIGAAQTRIAAILLFTLRGTPTIYYGDEIGMRNVSIPDSEVQDPQGLNMPGKNLSRDPQRTPMQWNASPNAGFTNGKPWLRLDEDFGNENVESQLRDPDSILMLYKRLIATRQQEPSLSIGEYVAVYSDHQMLAYIRQAKGHNRFLVVLNLSAEPCEFNPKNFPFKGIIVLATVTTMENIPVRDRLLLKANDGVVVRIEG